VDIATGQVERDRKPENPSAASEFARQGGLKGGRIRAERLSPAERRKIAKAAAAARWKKREPEDAT